MSKTNAKRRALFLALASPFLVLTPRVCFGQNKKDGTPTKGVPGEAEPTKANDEPDKVVNGIEKEKDAAKKSKSVVLSVVVTGAGKPIAQAEVKVKFPPNVGGEATIPTKVDGKATFFSSGTGTAEVRVIVLKSQWKSFRGDIELKEGPQELKVDLELLPAGK